MIIGLDAHTLGSRVGGNETYIHGLISGLKKIDRKNEYILYLTLDSLPNGSLKESPNFKIKRLWPTHPLIRIPFVMPFHLAQDRLDVSLFQFVAPPIAAGTYILSVHDLAYEHYPDCFKNHELLRLKMTTSYSARRAARVVTCSEYSKRDLVRFYRLRPDKIEVVYLGRGENFRPISDQEKIRRVRTKYGTGSKFVLYVGNIQPRKNLVRLIRAFGILKKRHSIVQKLVVVGEKAWLYSDAFKEIRNQGLESEVVITGYVPEDDLPLLYNAADAFVYPSLFEGFGLPVLEAMSCGTPVITSNVSSLPEIAGDAAWYVDPISVDDIVDAVYKVISNESLQLSLRGKGLIRAQKFSWETTASHMLELFESVAARGRKKKEVDAN